MHNKRGQEFGINSAVLVVIVVIVLGLVAAGIFMGWENLSAWIQPDTVSITSGKCVMACNKNSEVDFCVSETKFKASRTRVKGLVNEDTLNRLKTEETTAKELFSNLLLEKSGTSITYSTLVAGQETQKTATIKDYLTDQLSTPITAKQIYNFIEPRETGAFYTNQFSTVFSSKIYPGTLDAMSQGVFRTVIEDLADSSEFSAYTQAVQRVVDYQTVLDYQKSIGGVTVKGYSCYELSQHPVWKSYFKECSSNENLCASNTGVVDERTDFMARL